MATLGDALRAFKSGNDLMLRAPRIDSAQIAREQEARRECAAAIVRWLARRWDTEDEAFTLDVYGVLSVDCGTWETWLDLAPIKELARALKLIEAEDAYLGAQSPWRKR